MLRIIKEFRPHWIVGENVAGITNMAQQQSVPEMGGETDIEEDYNDCGNADGVLWEIINSLEEIGYNVQPFIIPACAVNAPHRRDRVWIVAHTRLLGQKKQEQQTTGVKQPDNDVTDPKSWESGEQTEQKGRKNFSGGNSNASNTTSKRRDTGSGDRQRGQILPSEIGKVKKNKQTGDRRKLRAVEGNSNAPDTESERMERRSRSEPSKSESIGHNKWSSREWNKNWLEVATELCGIYDELSLWMDGYFKRIIGKEFYGSSNKENRTKDLSILREEICKEEIWGKLGRLFQVEEKEILLKVLCRIEEVANGQDDIQYPSEESKAERKVRELWKSAYFMRSPHRRKYQEQFAGELKSIVQELSYETALEIAKTWDCLQCCHSSLTSPEAELDGFKLTKAKHREERLKALGNAIVPQVAIEIMRAIKNSEQWG